MKWSHRVLGILKLSSQPYRYKNSLVETGRMGEIFPSIPVDYSTGFSITGKMKGKHATLELNFGFGEENAKNYLLKILMLEIF